MSNHMVHSRRKFLITGAAVTAGTLLPTLAMGEEKQSGQNASPKDANISPFLEPRKLGTLEVSSISFGVQNMGRKDETVN